MKTFETDVLHNMDCLEGMKNIPDRSVDMVLCDLPYGILKHANNPHTYWDRIIPFEPLWEAYRRVTKPDAAIVLTAVQPFATALVNSNPAMFRYELIWAKSRASGFLNARKMPNRAHENILVFYDSPPTYTPQKYEVADFFKKRSRAKAKAASKSRAFQVNNRPDYRYSDDGTRYPDSILEFRSVARKGMHPTEKPLGLFSWLIRSYTKRGDVVLDNCMGSGTTALSCILEDRRFIGFEKDPGYFEMANERILKVRSSALG